MFAGTVAVGHRYKESKRKGGEAAEGEGGGRGMKGKGGRERKAGGEEKS